LQTFTDRGSRFSAVIDELVIGGCTRSRRSTSRSSRSVCPRSTNRSGSPSGLERAVPFQNRPAPLPRETGECPASICPPITSEKMPCSMLHYFQDQTKESLCCVFSSRNSESVAHEVTTGRLCFVVFRFFGASDLSAA
jgi:hypothetical protein